MLRTMLKSKIHRATVTQADLHYVGSVTVDADLMDAAICSRRAGLIVDIDNGARLYTYAISGERGSGVIGINGAAAHLVIPATWSSSSPTAPWRTPRPAPLSPHVVFVDAHNKILELGATRTPPTSVELMSPR